MTKPLDYLRSRPVPVLALLVRTIHMIREYHAGFLATGDTRYAWGIAECQHEIEIYLIPEIMNGIR